VASTVEFGRPHSYVYLTGPKGPQLSLNGRPDLEQWTVASADGSWEQLRLSTELACRGVDLYHSPLFTCPIVRQVRSIITLYDVIPESHPEFCTRAFLEFYRSRLGPSVRAAERIVTMSQSAKSDIVKHLKIPAEKIEVIYQGISEGFSPENRARLPALRGKLKLPERYVLFVGMLDARKNVERLILAYGLVAREIPGLFLLIVGRKDDPSFSLDEAIEKSGAGERIVQLGYVANEELPALYAGAEVFAFPSLSEGFGRPVVEAMASGVPVVTSNLSSLPEIAGEAALLVNPTEVEAIAEGMIRLCKDETLRSTLTRRGLARAGEFTRRKFGERLVEFYNKLQSEL
jgi:glycosyltransferase involved in cell wall biosynthesis